MRGKRFCIRLLLFLVAGIFAAQSGVFAQDASKGIVPFGGKIPQGAIAGLYEGPEKQQNGKAVRNYIRLLADGTVLEAITSRSREDAARLLVKGAAEPIAVGTFKLEAGHIEMTTVNKDATVHFQGEVRGDSLVLDWKSTFENHVGKQEVFKLIPGL